MKFSPNTYRTHPNNNKIVIKLFITLLSLYPSITFTQTIFQEKATEVGIDHYFHNGNLMGGGVAVFDFNQDGWEDIWINGGSHRDVLYQNKGDGSFIEIGEAAGLGLTANFRTTGVVTGDINNDGFRDVFITTREDTPNIIFQNNGDGTFKDISFSAGINDLIAWSTTAAFADINLDGYLDIYVGNYVEKFGYIADRELGVLSGYDHECQPNYLLINNGDGTFTEKGQALLVADEGCALASTFTDFDNDNDVDLMVINDYGQWVVPNNLLINQSTETQPEFFSAIEDASAIKVGIYAMGIAGGDYDKDNDLDYYITNLGRNALLQNIGDGKFVDTTAFAGLEDTYAGADLTVGWGTSFLDIDNDSDLDLIVANGFISALSFNRTSLQNEDKLFINQGYSQEKGGVTFTDESKICGLGDEATARGLAKGDFDNDGDIDLVIVRVNGSHNPAFRKPVLYYENQLNNGNNWLKVNLKGINNTDAYGAHLRIVVNGESWIEEINGGSSHASQHSSIVHFGLGKADKVDSLIISHLGGSEEIRTDISVNQSLNITAQSEMVTNVFEVKNDKEFNLSIQPNPIYKEALIQFKNPNKETISLKISDALGNIILNHQTNNNQLVINRNQLPNGFYLLQLQDKTGNSVVAKFLVQ